MHLWRLALHPAPSTCPSLKFAQTSPARCTRDIFRPYILLWNNHIWNNIFSCTPGIRGAPQSQDSDRLRAARSRALPLAPARPCRAAITCISLSLSLSLSLYIYIYIYFFSFYIYTYIYIYIYIYTHTHTHTLYNVAANESIRVVARGGTPGSHSKISRYKIFAKGWVAQKPSVL